MSSRSGLSYAAIESKECLRDQPCQGGIECGVGSWFESIRDPVAFAQCRDVAAQQLFSEAMARLSLAEEILAAVAELKPLLEAPLMGWARGNLDDMERQLAQLVYPGFLRQTPADVLTQYPRYLKAMMMRSERAKRDPSRDQARMLETQAIFRCSGSVNGSGCFRHTGVGDIALGCGGVAGFTVCPGIGCTLGDFGQEIGAEVIHAALREEVFTDVQVGCCRQCRLTAGPCRDTASDRGYMVCW